MIDFDSIVLSPLQGIFGEPITVTPTISQPSAPAYAARGIWSTEPIEVALVGGNVVQSSTPTIDIRSSEFLVAPVQGDLIQARGRHWEVFEVRPDSGGAVKLMIKDAP